MDSEGPSPGRFPATLCCMAVYHVYLKDKDRIVPVEADTEFKDGAFIQFKKGSDLVAEFKLAEIQGYTKGVSKE